MSEPVLQVASRAVLPRGTIIGPYRVLRQVGRGTTAVVLAAEPLAGGPVIALKVAMAGTADDDVARTRFLRGARAQAALRHPNIVPVHAAGTDPVHGPWLAMTLVGGTTLGALHADGRLDSARALALLAQVAAGLDAAHAAGVVHRDVKPSNVLVDGDHATLADFGLAREAADHTRTGAVVGTLPYLAPELVRGEHPSAASDRYALAAIAYELLVGDVVFPRPTDAAILYAHVDETVPAASGRRPGLPAAVDDVLARGLAKAASDRPVSAPALIAALDRALDGVALPAPSRRGDSGAPTVSPAGTGAASGPTATAHRRGPSPRVRLIVLGIFAATGAAGAVAVVGAGDEGGPARAAVPSLAQGQVALGSALAAGDVTGRDCRDRAASGSSPACTVLQTELPGRRLVVPRSGAIRAWTVRGAKGELVLQVLRRRERQIFQVFRSQPEVVPDAGVHRFTTELPAEAGDLLALALLPGAQAGVVADAVGARTERWSGPVGSDRGPGTRTGFAHEVQLRVDFEPGATIPPPRQITGVAARSVPAGREVSADDTLLPDKRRVRVALVEVGGKVYVDLYRGGIRRARCLVPDLVAGGTVVEFRPYESKGNPSQLNVGWRNPGTSSDILHYFGLDAEALEYYS